MEEHYLIMIDPAENHNKFYHIIPLGGQSFQAVYGRVGQSGTTVTYYGESKFRSLLDQKLKKGYRDETNIRTITPTTTADSDDDSSDILQTLYNCARGMVRHICRNVDVSRQQIKAARDWITRMSNNTGTMSVQTFNQLLVELFYMIPRPTSSVESLLAHSTDDFSKILTREFNLLNALGANVQTADGSDTMPDTSDLTVTLCDSDAVEELKSHMDSWTASRVVRIWEIRSEKQDKALKLWMDENKATETKLLCHGSGDENWWSILTVGLIPNPMNAHITGRMFGPGDYFSLPEEARKAVGYTSLDGSCWRKGHSPTGHFGLYEVAYKKPLHVSDYKSSYHLFPKGLPHGCCCVHAHAGRVLYHDEIVIYNRDACAVRYLVELRR